MKRTRTRSPRQSPQQRSSVYRGVTRHRWTGRYEAHLWDKNCWSESQNKKGRQVYLGAYDDEEAAAHAYDLAALKFWGQETMLNFTLTTYQKEIIEMEGQSKEEYIGSLRRKSSGFSRGVSKYRGVARHHHNGRWEARIGRVFGNKYLYLGTYATEEEAATAYDIAAIEHRGHNAVTNFDINHYINSLEPLDNNLTNYRPMQNSSQQLGVDLLDNHQESTNSPIETTAILASPRVDPTSSPLLLKSSKFTELKQTAPSNSSSSPAKSGPQRSSFPDDIQTWFDIQDSSRLAEEHGIIFGEYDSFASLMFQYELDT